MIFCGSLVSLVVGLVLFGEVVECFPSGPPTSVCSSLIPVGHTGTGQASDAPGDFFIYTSLLNDGNNGAYLAGTTYNVTLASPNGQEFLGFIIQARIAGTTSPIGSFIGIDGTTPGADYQHLVCAGSSESTVAHTNNNIKTRLDFQWTAPGSAGAVEFRYTIVTGRFEDYYGNLNAADHRPSCPFLPTEFGEHTFRQGLPANCSGIECDYYVGMKVNRYDSRYLDVYLDGEASGWIAIGFSLNQLMESDDVLGCRAAPVDGSTVTVLDTWNPSLRFSPNTLDDSQNDTCTHSSSFSDGRITCSFSRRIIPTNNLQSYNLNNSFYLFYGRRPTAQTGGDALGAHTVDGINPIISDSTYNPVVDTNIQTDEGGVTVPEIPVGVEIGELPTEQHGITGTFHVLDSKTIFIEDFNYDGMAPGAFFYYYGPGVTVTPFGGGFIIPLPSEYAEDEQSQFPGSLIMSRFTDVDITVTLPDGVDACDIGTFTIWAQQERLVLTRIEIPRNIFVNGGEGENCILLGDDTAPENSEGPQQCGITDFSYVKQSHKERICKALQASGEMLPSSCQ